MKINFVMRLLAALALVSLVALLAISSDAQVAVAQAIPPKLQFLDANGTPLAGGCVQTYSAGTTTPLASYTDSTGLTVNTNPVILDAGGFANIWLSANLYKFQVKSTGGINCASGTLQYTIDNVSNQGLIAQAKSVLLAPSGGVEQDVSGIVGATSFHGTLAHTTSTGVRVAILAPTTVLDSASNPPNLITNSPAVAGYNYRLYDPLGHSNVVLSPDPTQAGGNTLDCSQVTAGLTCKRYTFLYFPGGSCNNTTANMGWDTFATNSPTPLCFTGTNTQKGVLALPSAATKAQENTNSAAGAGTCTVTYPSATIAGDLLVGWTVVDTSRTVTGVTDGTNAYTAANTVANGAVRLAVYYFNGSSTAMAAGSTLTFTFSAAGNSVCGFLAYKDIKTVAQLDVTTQNTGGTTAVSTSTTAGTAQNTELVLSFVGAPSNPSVTFQSGTVGHTTVSQSTNVTGSSEGVIAQTTGTQSGSFTLGTAQNWAATVVTFKANVGASVTAQRSFMVPPTYVSTLPINSQLKWQGALVPTGTVNVKLGASLVCTADGNTDDPVFNATSTVTTAVSPSATGVTTQSTLSGLVSTGCAASNLMHYQVQRSRYEAADTYEGYVYLIGAGLQYGIN